MSFQDGVGGCRRIMLFETAPPVPPMPIIIPCVSQTSTNASIVGDLATPLLAAQTVNGGASPVTNLVSELTHDELTTTSQLPTSISAQSTASPSVASDVHLWSPPGDVNVSIAVASPQLTAAASTAMLTG